MGKVESVEYSCGSIEITYLDDPVFENGELLEPDYTWESFRIDDAYDPDSKANVIEDDADLDPTRLTIAQGIVVRNIGRGAFDLMQWHDKINPGAFDLWFGEMNALKRADIITPSEFIIAKGIALGIAATHDKNNGRNRRLKRVSDEQHEQDLETIAYLEGTRSAELPAHLSVSYRKL